MVLPVYPYPGGVAGAEPPDPVAGAVGHFSWSNWIKAAVKKLDAEATPVGSIIMFGGSVAPAGWHLCNGTAHGSAALEAVVGATTPNLVDKFIVAAGSLYAQGAQGGANTVKLSAAESGLRNHAHGADSSVVDLNHAHVFSTSGSGGHTHNHYSSNLLSAEGDFNPAGSGHKFLIGTDGIVITGGAHEHSGGTDWMNQNNLHAHTVTIAGSGDAEATIAHENRPPYYALTYIIKK